MNHNKQTKKFVIFAVFEAVAVICTYICANNWLFAHIYVQIISYLHIHLATFTKTNLKFLILTLRTEDVLRILTLRTEDVHENLTLRTEDVLKKCGQSGS